MMIQDQQGREWMARQQTQMDMKQIQSTWPTLHLHPHGGLMSYDSICLIFHFHDSSGMWLSIEALQALLFLWYFYIIISLIYILFKRDS